MRPTYKEYFLKIAEEVSTRSLDPHTKHGAVIVENNKIVGTGYNSWAHSLRDNMWSWERPAKYNGPLIHSELNAILNLVRPVTNATMYVTGHSCWNCLVSMWQAGIKHVVMYDHHGTYEHTDEEKVQQFLKETGMTIEKVERQYTARELAFFQGIRFNSREERDILMAEAEDVVRRLKNTRGIATIGYGSPNGEIQILK